MKNALKAEALKLLSVRSAYVVVGLASLITLFFAGFTEGFKASGGALTNPHLLASEVTTAVNVLAILAGILAALMFSHEYRFNTIIYSLTHINSRTKFLASKIIVTSLFSVLFILFIGALSPLATLIGIHLSGNELAVGQIIPYGDLLWRCLLHGWGYAVVGLLLVSLTRSQVFAIVALFFAPAIELILALVLKENGKYLPFNALSSIINDNPMISHGKAALVFVTYLAVGWLIAWILFLRRDAT